MAYCKLRKANTVREHLSLKKWKQINESLKAYKKHKIIAKSSIKKKEDLNLMI